MRLECNTAYKDSRPKEGESEQWISVQNPNQTSTLNKPLLSTKKQRSWIPPRPRHGPTSRAPKKSLVKYGRSISAGNAAQTSLGSDAKAQVSREMCLARAVKRHLHRLQVDSAVEAAKKLPKNATRVDLGRCIANYRTTQQNFPDRHTALVKLVQEVPRTKPAMWKGRLSSLSALANVP